MQSAHCNCNLINKSVTQQTKLEKAPLFGSVMTSTLALLTDNCCHALWQPDAFKPALQSAENGNIIPFWTFSRALSRAVIPHSEFPTNTMYTVYMVDYRPATTIFTLADQVMFSLASGFFCWSVGFVGRINHKLLNVFPQSCGQEWTTLTFDEDKGTDPKTFFSFSLTSTFTFFFWIGQLWHLYWTTAIYLCSSFEFCLFCRTCVWFLEHSRETRGTCREAFAFHVARDSLLCRRWLFLPDLNSMRPWWLICALCVSQCVTGALVADWPQCAYVSLHVVLYVSALKKKKKRPGGLKTACVRERNQLHVYKVGGGLFALRPINQCQPRHTHTHTHTHTYTD